MLSSAERLALIEKLEQLPSQVEEFVTNLTDEQLTTHFLDGEWTVAQNVHHLVDSHINSYIRCKLMLTEDHPMLRPYNQDDWAALPDASRADVGDSLTILRGLHHRWGVFFRGLSEDEWSRGGHHPESGTVTLEDQLRIYAAHGEGHIDQMTRTLAAQRTP